MKKVMLVLLVVLAATAVAMAGRNTSGSPIKRDILGAHLGYGRGCIMCHAPHSGAHGNDVASTDPTTGNYILWGQDLTPLYGQTVNFVGASQLHCLPLSPQCPQRRGRIQADKTAPSAIVTPPPSSSYA